MYLTHKIIKFKISTLKYGPTVIRPKQFLLKKKRKQKKGNTERMGKIIKGFILSYVIKFL